MGRPCTVCAHLERMTIDTRLARQVVNLSAVAREFGLKRDALRQHRERHLPDFLTAFTASVGAPATGTLQAEYQRLYLVALDELARAQAGTLIGIDEHGKEKRTISSTAIARAIDNVRRALDGVTRLAADAANEAEAPSGTARGELAQRILARLEAMDSRQIVHNYAAEDTLPAIEAASVPTPYAPECIAPSLPDATSDTLACPDDPMGGGQGGGGPHASTSQMSLDAATPPPTSPADLPGLSSHPRLRQVVADHEASVQHEATTEDTNSVMYVPNPRWPGSEAASREERTAGGYPDVGVTREDIKSLPPEIKALIADHRRRTDAEAHPPSQTP